MNRAFFLYILRYIFKAKSRQHLLLFAFVGLLFSSFSLLSIQALMGGLQNGVVSRSKNVIGKQVLFLDKKFTRTKWLIDLLQQHKVNFSAELEVELLLKKGGRVLPAIIHGIMVNHIPPFLQRKHITDFILPYDFSYRMDLAVGEQFSLIYPADTLYSLDGIPRMATGVVESFISTNVPEVDEINIWTRIKFLQNFLHRRDINRIRIYSTLPTALAGQLREIKGIKIKSWQELNRDLAWALTLESRMMFGLFVSVIFLVSISIVSGQLIFWSKIRQDLVGMWLLGASPKKIFKAALSSFISINLGAIGGGIILALIALALFSQFGGNILPDIFVEQKVPVFISSGTIFLSVSFPFFLSSFFSYFTLKLLLKDTKFIALLRTP